VPEIAIILGDRNGIGPELVARYLAESILPENISLVAIGDANVLRLGASHAGIDLEIPSISDASEIGKHKIAILDRPFDAPLIPMGAITKPSGQEMIANWNFVCELINQKMVDGLVYGPMNKQAMALAGHIAGDELDLLNSKLSPTSMTGEINILNKLWTSRVTSHVPLRGVAHLISQEHISDATKLLADALKLAGNQSPKIAVAALNPHAGEGGLFGHEETEIIAPAIEKLKATGLNVSGPYPSDTIFPVALGEEFDAIVTMFHDQGQIALKLLGLGKSVTFLAGFPVPIATPGHGTAFDIAGKGIAKSDGFEAAAALAIRVALTRDHS